MTTTINTPLGRARTLVLCGACLLMLPVLALLLVGQSLVGSRVRALRMCLAVDQCGNAALGGSEDETISSRAWRAKQAGRPWGATAVRVIDALFGEGHCSRAEGI